MVIGGGTGLSVLLRGLKEYSSNITAIVTVGDDGGSSGRIREEFGMVPVGDVRNCIVALSDREDLMEQIFDYRFQQGEGLDGQRAADCRPYAQSPQPHSTTSPPNRSLNLQRLHRDLQKIPSGDFARACFRV